jgi:hypothetical protein
MRLLQSILPHTSSFPRLCCPHGRWHGLSFGMGVGGVIQYFYSSGRWPFGFVSKFASERCLNLSTTVRRNLQPLLGNTKKGTLKFTLDQEQIQVLVHQGTSRWHWGFWSVIFTDILSNDLENNPLERYGHLEMWIHFWPYGHIIRKPQFSETLSHR